MFPRLGRCTSCLFHKINLETFSNAHPSKYGRGRISTGGAPVTILSEEETQMKNMATKFASDNIQPIVKEMDENCKMPDSLIARMFENGYFIFTYTHIKNVHYQLIVLASEYETQLLGIDIPTEYKGSGSSFFVSNLITEEVAKVDMSVSLLLDIQNTVINPMVMRLGTEQQKDKYLPRLATDMVGSFCLSEPESGSDAFSMKTTARKDGGHYVLNGTKCWTSNAEQAGLFIVMANAKPTDGYRGITCFLVDRDSEGLELGKREDKLGIRASSTCMVYFDNVKVPEENILGEFGQGYKYAICMLNEGRIGIGAQKANLYNLYMEVAGVSFFPQSVNRPQMISRLCGVAQGCMDRTLPYVMEQKQFGQPFWKSQAIQHQIAEMCTRIEAARLLVYNTARLKEAGQPFIKQAAMTKFYASEVACAATTKCIEWMGTVGFSTYYPIEKYYRDCKVGPIYEGTSNIQLNTIAKHVELEQ